MKQVANEFRGAKFGDPRRVARLVKIAGRMADRPEASFPSVLNETELEGAYRFFSSEWVNLEAILAPHIGSTWRRAGGDRVTLALHDTTTLSFRAFGQRLGIAPNSRGTQQFLAHVTLAVQGDETRRPHGLFAVSTYQLEQDDDVHERWQKQVAAVAAHPDARSCVVHVMDREADDYALLSYLVGHDHRFVVRAQYDRALLGEHAKMRDALGAVDIMETREVELAARSRGRAESKQRQIHPERQGRLTTLAFSAIQLTIPRPASAQGKGCPAELTINVVRVWEINPPAGEKPIEWLLLTSEPITTREQVAQVIDWYRSRWVIEEYFKALKTGCAYEKRQLESFHALRNALGVFAPMAWQLLLLRTEARHRPLSPASVALTQDHLDVLRATARKPLAAQPDVRDVMSAVASLGGHLPRNGDPGWLVLGRGLEKLETLTAGWRLRKSSETSDQ